MKDSVKNNEIVLTGQYLGVVEEYLPDKQSTYIKEGQIYATKTGIVKIDKDRRAIEILSHQEKDRKTVKIGDVIIGTILFLRLYSVGISFATINKKVQFNSSYFGNIHVSHISKQFIEKISDAFQITDIVRAKVIRQEENEYSLSTAGKDLGVIHADCSICGTTLEQIGQDKLRCSRCGNVENRKLANDYGNILENLRY
ncbi:MAG: exosome complex RNA-binding protein Csl4 [Candidatus Hermodarchaeota archaeon]